MLDQKAINSMKETSTKAPILTSETEDIPIAQLTIAKNNRTSQPDKTVKEGGFFKGRGLRLKTLAGFTMSFLIILLIFLNVKVDFNMVWSNIQKIGFFWLLTAFLIFFAGFVIRGLRWKLLLDNAGFNKETDVQLPKIPTLVRIVFLSGFINCLIPAKLGEAYRCYLLKINCQASFSRSLGTIFAERSADLLVLFTLLCVSGLIAFSSVIEKMAELWLVFGFGLGLFAFIIVSLFILRFFSVGIERLIPTRGREFFRRFHQGIFSGFTGATQLKLYTFTIVLWLMESLRLFCVLQGLNVQLDLAVVIFIALTAALLTALPFTPAGLGAVEGFTLFVLTTFSVEKNLAVSVTIIDRVITYWSLVILGLIIYFLGNRKVFLFLKTLGLKVANITAKLKPKT